jgi:hypothetical protein
MMKGRHNGVGQGTMSEPTLGDIMASHVAEQRAQARRSKDKMRVHQAIHHAKDIAAFSMAAGSVRHFIRRHTGEHVDIDGLVYLLRAKGYDIIEALDPGAPAYGLRCARRVAQEVRETVEAWNASTLEDNG